MEGSQGHQNKAGLVESLVAGWISKQKLYFKIIVNVNKYHSRKNFVIYHQFRLDVLNFLVFGV